jgi:hypothetical protein
VVRLRALDGRTSIPGSSALPSAPKSWKAKNQALLRDSGEELGVQGRVIAPPGFPPVRTRSLLHTARHVMGSLRDGTLTGSQPVVGANIAAGIGPVADDRRKRKTLQRGRVGEINGKVARFGTHCSSGGSANHGEPIRCGCDKLNTSKVLTYRAPHKLTRVRIHSQ